MRLYCTDAGQWAGTQADARALAGKAWEEVDVPTDKPGLLAWLNGNKVAAGGPSAVPGLTLAPIVVAEATHLAEPAPIAAPTTCPKCSRTPRAAETLAKGDDIEALAEWIWRAEGWQIERVLGALGGRLAELRDGREARR